ncbi:MAG: hypothetical protein IJF65_02085 [Clostridia bacterium]|nr:hypothetical protein [Clostridia bacterium]
MATPKKKRPNVLHDQSKQSNSDVLGSYTGTPADQNDTPVQDVDDL